MMKLLSILVFSFACSSKPQRVTTFTCGIENGISKDAWEPERCAESIRDFLSKHPEASVDSIAVAERNGFASVIVVYRGKLSNGGK